MHTFMAMTTETSAAATARIRLLQLVSPSLPIGAFTYSQGLEWAVESGWVRGADDLAEWLGDALRTGICHLEIPLFARLHSAYADGDNDAARSWIDYLLASRETAELRAEELQRGRAFARLLPELGCGPDPEVTEQLQRTQLAGFAWLVNRWKIEPGQAIEAYTWSWLENLTLAGIKLIPLGQTDGQKIILRLGEVLHQAVVTGLRLSDEEIGFSCTAMAIASSLHETQYTRLYRS